MRPILDLGGSTSDKGDMRRAHEARLYALTTASACGLALLAGVVGAPARAVMQNLVFDQYQRWKPRPYAFDQPVRIVAIDDESLKRLGQWPWPRERLAECLRCDGIFETPEGDAEVVCASCLAASTTGV